MRLPRKPALAVLAVGLLLTACSAPSGPSTDAEGSDPGQATSSPSAPAPSSTAPSSTAPSSAPPSSTPPSAAAPAPTDAVEVAITVRDGRVQGSVQTAKVRAGQTVKVSATLDTADSIHVHGYDKTIELTPNQTGSTTFVADVKGVFDIETHESELLVARLNVS